MDCSGSHRDRACGLVSSDGTATIRGAALCAPALDFYTWLIWAESGAVIQTLGERPRSMSFGAAGATHSGEARTQGAIRLALSGSAGTGKTTLGQSLAEHWGVPIHSRRDACAHRGRPATPSTQSRRTEGVGFQNFGITVSSGR